MAHTRRTLLRPGAVLAGGVLAGSALAGCTGRFPTLSGPEVETAASSLDRETDPQVSDADRDALVRGQTAFAFDLLDRVVAAGPDDNQFCSPYSVSVALGMTWAGARGGTAAEMAEALRIDLDSETYHAAVNALDLALAASAETAAADGDYQLSTVNALWGQTGYPFRESFLDTLAVDYGAGVNLLDFASDSEAARTTINDAVAAWTEGEITDLMPPGLVTDLTRFVLTNAVYFAADWAEAFDPDDTASETFTALGGEKQEVPTMRQKHEFPSAAVDGVHLVELPYVGETTGMVVLVPPEGEFEGFERALTAARLRELVGELQRRETIVRMPRFTFRSSVDLKPILSAMGMAGAFTEDADFGGIVDPSETDRPLFLHGAVHEAYVAVDEEGTEAAAATGVSGGNSSAGPEPLVVDVDRPFVFLVRDRETGAVLLLGRVVDAEAAQG